MSKARSWSNMLLCVAEEQNTVAGLAPGETGGYYLQGNNGETDIDNRPMGMRRGEERVRCMERVTWKLTLPYVK